MSEQAPRIFIPTGACVEEPTADLFTSKKTSQEAIAACKSCTQLDHCREQREPIADALALEGLTQAVVAGEVIQLERKQLNELAKPYFEYGEPTFHFAFRPLPTDGKRGLWTLQQAYRTQQLYGKVQKHPTADIEQLYTDRIRDRDMHIYRQSMDLPKVGLAITSLILSAVSLRDSSGKVYNGVEKYRDFDPEAYVEIVWQYALQASQVQHLGIPAHRAIAHNVDFYKNYLGAGQKAGVTAGLLRIAATRFRRDLLTQAQARQIDNLQGATRKRVNRARQKSNALQVPLLVQSQALRLAGKYAIVESTGSEISLHANLNYLDEFERAAIIYTYELNDYINPNMSFKDLERQVGDPARLTHTVLLPNVYAVHSGYTLVRRGNLEPEQFHLRNIRCELWGGNYRLAAKSSKNLADNNSVYALFEDGGWVEIDEHKLLFNVAWLQVLVKQYFADRNQKMDDKTFHAMALAYIKDVRALEREKQADAERVGLYYSGTTYRAIRDYGAVKYPDMPTSLIRQGFLRNIRTPLRLAAQTNRRYHDLQPLLAAYDFPDPAIKSLARRGVTDDEAKQVAVFVAQLATEMHGVLTAAYISAYCATRSFNPEALREGLLKKTQGSQSLV